MPSCLLHFFSNTFNSAFNFILRLKHETMVAINFVLENSSKLELLLLEKDSINSYPDSSLTK